MNHSSGLLREAVYLVQPEDQVFTVAQFGEMVEGSVIGDNDGFAFFVSPSSKHRAFTTKVWPSRWWDWKHTILVVNITHVVWFNMDAR